MLATRLLATLPTMFGWCKNFDCLLTVHFLIPINFYLVHTMIFKNASTIVSAALRNRRQKKAAIQSRRTQKSPRLDFNQLERRNLLATFVVNSTVDDASGVQDEFTKKAPDS